MTTQLNINTGFHLYHELGMTRDLRVRAEICEITSPRRGYRAVLLLSYKTCDRTPHLAAGYAVAAEFLFSGLSALEYRRAVATAKLEHGGSSAEQISRAKMRAFELLLTSRSAVCIFREQAVLDIVSGHTAEGISPAAPLSLVSQCPMYDGHAELKTSKGPVGPEGVHAQVRDTLAEGYCTYTVEGIKEAYAQGEHADWSRVRQPLAS